MDAHLRISKLRLPTGAFPCSSSEYRPQRTGVGAGVFEHDEYFFGDGISRRSPSSQSARFRRRAPFCGGRLACRAVAPLRVVKMRRRSLRSSFLRNYRKALSFSLRVNEIGQERRTEGIAIVTRSVNRVIPPPRGPRVKIYDFRLG